MATPQTAGAAADDEDHMATLSFDPRVFKCAPLDQQRLSGYPEGMPVCLRALSPHADAAFAAPRASDLQTKPHRFS